ncbi:uncharacterized protein METZ01_LOCUS407883, partial [marine metagenome]
MLKGESSTKQVIPTLALFAAASFRLMPATNRILGCFVALKFAIPSIDVIYKNHIELETKYKSFITSSVSREFALKKVIHLKDISFRYPGSSKYVLKNISLDIPKNKSIGIVGVSGSGKTTLLNILLGLIKPTKGTIEVDETQILDHIREWQKIIGFVPQDIYLTDDSIKSNIAFGINVSEIDELRVWKALELAQLDVFVKELRDGLDTFVGERGVRISGGQRQRIGIARALFHEPEILIFDEATSSLDNETEMEITKSIEKLSLQKTIIIVAHRLSTIA